MLECLSAAKDRMYSDSSSPAAYFDQVVFYDDAVGLAGYSSSYDDYGYKITQLDGLTHHRSAHRATNHFVLDQQDRGWLAATNPLNDAIYPFDTISGTYGDTAIISGGTNYVQNTQVRLLDRWLYAFANGTYNTFTIYSRPLDFSESWASEFSISISLTDNKSPSISRTESDHILCLVTTEGHVLWYDTDSMSQVGDISYLPSNDGAWYSAALGVYVVLDNNQVSVYATSPRPYTLDTPSAVGGVVKGTVVTVRTRLTGSNGEPCPNELIEWTLLAGSGELTESQSETDSDGYAETGYLAPLSIPDSPEVQALVRY